MLRDRKSFESLLQESGSPMVLFDSRGTITAINHRAVEILGGKEEDYLGREMVSLVDPVDRYFVRRRWEMMERDRSSINMTVRLKKPGGVSEWFAFHFETAQPESGERRLARIEHVALSGAHDW